MAHWIPEPRRLQEILETLYESTDMNVSVQRNITQKLQKFTTAPDYIAYLAHILTAMSNEDENIRSMTGYLLKNNAHLILKASPEVVHYVKAAVLHTFDDGSATIRRIVGEDIVSLLGIIEPRNWPECLIRIINTLENPDSDKEEAAIIVLKRMCEDYPRKLDFDIGGTRVLDCIVTRFLVLVNHQSPKMRSHAVASLAALVPHRFQSILGHTESFLASLIQRASDKNPSVRRCVCQAMAELLCASPEKLLPRSENVLSCMLEATKDENQDVVFEACEFWVACAEDIKLAPHLQPLLDRIAPALLDHVVCREDDLLWLAGDAEDAAVPDKESEIKPHHHGATTHGLERGDSAGSVQLPRPRIGTYGQELIDMDEDDDECDGDSDDEYPAEWTIRKSASFALDCLAETFRGDLLNVLQTPLEQKLASNDWLERESAIVALGTMAEACIETIEPHLGLLVPYLTNALNDSKPLVRSTACWTLGNCASWTARIISEEHKANCFIPTMEGLLRMVVDNNKRVQRTGCTAFAALEEEAGMEIAPYLEPVLRTLVLAFDKYQRKNMPALYDAVGTLAKSVGRELSNPTCSEMLLVPLTNRWHRLKDDDVDLIPLLECLAPVIIAMGASFLPHAPMVLGRCCRIINTFIAQYQHFQQDPDRDEPIESFPIVALDLLSGLTQALGMALDNLFTANLSHILTICLGHPQAPVRQSAYALVGHMASGCFTILRPLVPDIIAKVLLQLVADSRYEFFGALSNAAWSVGEISLRYDRDDRGFQQVVHPLISGLIALLLHAKAPQGLQKNAAVSIGRIGLMHPGLVAPRLEEFAQAWCRVLYQVRDSEEKDSAFRGLCTMVQVNPSGIVKSFLWFCISIVWWERPSQELNGMFASLLQAFKQDNEVVWATQVASFPEDIRQGLATRYGV